MIQNHDYKYENFINIVKNIRIRNVKNRFSLTARRSKRGSCPININAVTRTRILRVHSPTTRRRHEKR